ncbi:Sulfatase [Planctomycetes bacterium Poly30]|uniref:Sulfatase n=1 Tax=Saltatorellus ferox TaxID=2528018 RepID=A0A518EWT5_9BACT|nr:Sulfatase [Planctomycetes bacterium Poly30]
MHGPSSRTGAGFHLLFLSVAAVLVGCGPGSETRAAASAESRGDGGGRALVPRPDVLLVAVDGLALSDLSAFGGALADTVGFDRLSEEGAVYVDTFAPSPWPEEALAGALTGRTAAHLDGQPWTPSLAETLQHDGYRTALVLGHEQHLPHLLPSGVAPVTRAQATVLEAAAPIREGEPVPTVPGFERTLLPEEARSVVGARADDVVSACIEWLESHAEPAFLLATFGDPRPPHHLYRGLVPAADIPYEGPMKAGLSHAELLRMRDEFTDEDRQRLAELHATEVAMVDQAFRRLAGAMIQRRETPPVLIVIGLRPAALGEGGRYGLIPSFMPNALQVPMLIRFPEPLGETPEAIALRAAELRGDVEIQASLIDLTPTVLDALGFEPRYDLEGRSLFPGAAFQPRATFAMTRKGVRGGTLIEGNSAVSVQLAPLTLTYHTRPSPSDPFHSLPTPSSRELDLRQPLARYLESTGTASATELLNPKKK